MKPPQLRARYWRIVFFFGWVVLELLFWEVIVSHSVLAWLAHRTRAPRYRRIASHFRALATRMGGLMIKVGQFLSARLDVLPPEITSELSGLQDEVPPATFAAIREVAEAELGCALLEKYVWVEETPLAAASLGQVHCARLRSPEAEACGFGAVVVKVQRPFIEQIVQIDLAALRRVGGWLARYKPISRRVDVDALIEEFAGITYAEIDYRAEAHNAEVFAANFKDNPGVHVPRVVWKLTTRRVLTLENVYALKLDDYAAITAAGIDRGEVAARLFDAYMQQIFDDGFFHADPHPGNLFVTPLASTDAAGRRQWQLHFVDFGMVGHTPENLRRGLREAVIAVGMRDARRLVQAYRTLGVLLPGADLELLEAGSARLFERFWGMSMRELQRLDHVALLKFGLEFRELMYAMPFQLPENLLLLGRTAAILSGMCTGLNPDFNVWTAIMPYAERMLAAEGNAQWQTWLDEAGKFFQVLIGLPGRTDRVLTMLERGDLVLRVPQVSRQMIGLEVAVNRLTAGLVFAALLVGGVLLYASSACLGSVLMAAAAVPLAWLLLAGRGRNAQNAGE